MVTRGEFTYNLQGYEPHLGRFYMGGALEGISMWDVELKGIYPSRGKRNVEEVAKERDANFIGAFGYLYVLCKMTEKDLLNIKTRRLQQN